jgi:glutathione S-transferase
MTSQPTFILHWSPRSPFVRKVMVALHEKKMVEAVRCVRSVVPTDDPTLAIFNDNPLGTIPTLVLPDGRAIYGSSVILEYLDTVVAEPRLFAQDASARIAQRTIEALGDGLLETMVKWLVERMHQTDRTATMIARYDNKCRRALDAMAACCAPWRDQQVAVSTISIGCALAYLDFRFPGLAWRNGRPALERWYEGFEARPSMKATAFREG